MTRRVILIAFHFPPMQGSSGLLRTLSFARHLPEFGWEPLVLTAHPRAYAETSAHQVADIPEDLVVSRAFALDSARHLAVRGRYPGLLATPDRWWSWWLGGVPAGLRLARRWGARAIWSTAPIATAHLIALTIRRVTGLPWVADIRDLLTEPNEPAHPAAWRATHRIESRTLLTSDRVVVASPGQRTEYHRRFPTLPDGRIEVIPNGFDEGYFRDAECATPPARPRDRLLLVHSGVLYPDGRNPEPFFRAVSRLIGAGEIGREELEIRLRASGSEKRYGAAIRELGLESTVRLMPPLDYRDALAELLGADGLLLFQGLGTGTAIPAKLYEYFRAGRPILALTEPGGATARALGDAGYTRMAPLESAEAIAGALRAFLDDLRQHEGFGLPVEEARRYSRRNGCRRLAGVLDEVIS